MRGAVIDNPEDASSISVRGLAHDLIDQPTEGGDAGAALASTEEPGSMNVPGGGIHVRLSWASRSGAARWGEDAPWPGCWFFRRRRERTRRSSRVGLSRVCGPDPECGRPCGRNPDHEGRSKCDGARVEWHLRPASATPWCDRSRPPDRTDGVSLDLAQTKARQGKPVAVGHLAGQSLDLDDDLRGGNGPDGLFGEPLATLRGVVGKIVCATLKRFGPKCPGGRRCLYSAIPGQPAG